MVHFFHKNICNQLSHWQEDQSTNHVYPDWAMMQVMSSPIDPLIQQQAIIGQKFLSSYLMVYWCYIIGFLIIRLTVAPNLLCRHILTQLLLLLIFLHLIFG